MYISPVKSQPSCVHNECTWTCFRTLRSTTSGRVQPSLVEWKTLVWSIQYDRPTLCIPCKIFFFLNFCCFICCGPQNVVYIAFRRRKNLTIFVRNWKHILWYLHLTFFNFKYHGLPEGKHELDDQDITSSALSNALPSSSAQGAIIKSHSSRVTTVAACNCGRTQGTREDPFDLKNANYEFYQDLEKQCCSYLLHMTFPRCPVDDPMLKVKKGKRGESFYTNSSYFDLNNRV